MGTYPARDRRGPHAFSKQAISRINCLVIVEAYPILELLNPLRVGFDNVLKSLLNGALIGKQECFDAIAIASQLQLLEFFCRQWSAIILATSALAVGYGLEQIRNMRLARRK